MMNSTEVSLATIPPVELMFGVLSVLCFLVGTPTSLFCLLFFWEKPRKTINCIMFVLISATDMVTCLLVLFVGCSAFQFHLFFENGVFCQLWGVLWSVAIKLSIVMIAVLSVTRTVSILYPLSKVSPKVFLGIVGVYLALFLVHSTVPYWFGLTYTYYHRAARCTWDDIDVYGWGLGKVVEYVLTPILTFLAPTLTVIVCFCVLICKLLFRAHQQEQQRSRGNSATGRPVRSSVISMASTMSIRGDVKVHSTITVLILTVFYLALTVPSTVIRLIGYTYELHHQAAYKQTVSYDLYRLFTTYFLPINSVCNTIVYFVRIKDLRRNTFRMLCRLWCRLICRPSPVPEVSRVIVNSVAMSCIERKISAGAQNTMHRRLSGNNVQNIRIARMDSISPKLSRVESGSEHLTDSDK